MISTFDQTYLQSFPKMCWIKSLKVALELGNSLIEYFSENFSFQLLIFS